MTPCVLAEQPALKRASKSGEQTGGVNADEFRETLCPEPVPSQPLDGLAKSS